MGPRAVDVLGAVTDDPFPGIGFFELDTVAIGGHEVYVLGHQISGDRGVELFGPYEHHDEIEERLLDAGEAYDMRRLGSKSYKSANVESAWIPLPVPAVYDGEPHRDYREWESAESWPANIAIGGSYAPEDVSDYYLTPDALGYEHLVSFDHDFIGRAALEEILADPDWSRVTLVWDDADVVDVYASLFREGDPNQFVELPDTAMSAGENTRYDGVRKDGELVGFAKWLGYDSNEREMLSLGCIEVEHAEPGTEVTLVWGEANQQRSRVERHDVREVGATVAPAPYVERGRRSTQA